MRLGKTERSVAKKVAIYESLIASSRGKMFEITEDPRKTSSEPTLQNRYDEFKVYERFRYIIRFWSTKIRLDGKGASTRGVCWDTLEQRASNKRGRCAQMRWKEKGMAGNREERNEEEKEGSGF